MSELENNGAGAPQANEVVEMLKNDRMKMTGAIGGLLMLVSAFLPWISAEVPGTEVKCSIFGTGFVGILAGLVIICAGAAIIGWHIADAVPAVKSLKEKYASAPNLYLALVGAGVACTMLAITTCKVSIGGQSMTYEAIEALSKLSGGIVDVSHGAGPIISIIGAVLSIIPWAKNR